MLRFVIKIGWMGVCIAGLLFGTSPAFAQNQGFLGISAATSGAVQDMLPPGATYEGTHVLHKINSTTENLHLLSAYYFGGNTRLWKKIYQDNRAVIKNPDRLPVGATLRIEVGENWKPRFSYNDWFALAVRNGEWKPGTPWQRASKGAGQPTPDAVASQTPASQVTPPSATSILGSAPETQPAAATPTPAANAQPAEAPTPTPVPTEKPVDPTPPPAKGPSY